MSPAARVEPRDRRPAAVSVATTSCPFQTVNPYLGTWTAMGQS